MYQKRETLCTLALSRLAFYHIPAMRYLLDKAGSAEELFNHRQDIREIYPECNQLIVDTFRNSSEALLRAEQEITFAEKHHIRCLTLNDADYPQRLRECNDAPLALFFLGQAELNAKRVVSIVGTRHCTQYGKDLVEKFVRELREICPNVLITSGLAYGVDICAHRQALTSGLPTVGVLAHGLDTLYPSAHRNTAKQMLEHGGLLTEYFTKTNADRINFLRRNRIVAGMADATIVVESAARGGSLSTARIANEYNRDVFAFPGRIGDENSEGCNHLIYNHKAHLLLSAEEFVKTMQWPEAYQKQNNKKDVQLELFPALSEAEQRIVATLKQNNDLHINILSTQSQTAIPQLASILLDLEMKGLVRELTGGVYHYII